MQIRAGSTYRNKKNKKVYRVVAIANHTETMEGIVIYARAGNWLDKGLIWTAAIALKLALALVWARPVEIFQEKFTEK